MTRLDQATLPVPLDALTIRPATIADAAVVRELLVELGYAQLDVEPDATALVATLAQVLADDSRHTWLAELSGQVVGLLTLSTHAQLRLAGLVVTVEELVVRAATRGAGIGTALVRKAQEHATQVGARRLELLTNRSRPVYERGFYLKCGFAEANSAVMRWSVPGA
jgi:N-acetylglutamate synthase-like GNAT family acetyltransferase